MARHIHIHVSTKDAGNWEESKHPRADNGQFGKGSGGGAKPAAKKAPAAKKEIPAIAVKTSNRGPGALAQMQAQSNAHLKATGFGHLVTPAKNKPGTHVKIDKGGEITAGPKGMTGKKPSELAKKSGSTPAPGQQAQTASALGPAAGEGPRGASRVGSAGPATTKTDWSKSNGDWTAAKKEGAAMFERAMSSAKTGGDRTDAALKLKAEAAEQQKNGSYLGAVVLGLVNDYFDRLKRWGANQ